jgi:3',5'-cyclic AMP phosphodiesterase CpdA
MKIAHISDLHFGAHEDEVRDALLAHLNGAGLDLVIASGDITQSATVDEFEQAQAFFSKLTCPLLCIPGNHDLPGMDLERFISPFGRYKRFIAQELNPQFQSELVQVKGINSARMILPHWNWANGSISRPQCRDIKRTFAASTAPWRVVTVHHPAMNSKDFPLDVSLFNVRRFLSAVDEAKVDVVLAGHQHHAYIEPRVMDGHTTLFLNASTGMSHRIRRQPHGFNILNFAPTSVRIDMLRYDRGQFTIFEAMSHSK